MKSAAVGLCVLVVAALVPERALDAATSCTGMVNVSLPGATITLATVVEPGAFTPPVPGTDPQAYRALPVFCRVAATLRPTRDSEIRIEVWMPAAGWNGKLQAVGNGAFNGAIAYRAMAAALVRGYAAASTDTGHTGAGASFALGHPEKVIDFGWRAVHEMTVTSKRIMSAHYDRVRSFPIGTAVRPADVRR